jgi:hypothetical protein
VYDEMVSKWHKLIIIQFNDPFLCVISTALNSDCVKFVRYNLKAFSVTMIIIGDISYIINNLQLYLCFRVCAHALIIFIKDVR